MKKNVIYITTVALMVMACVEENFKQPNPFEGDEVLFSATLTKEPVTRTIYGEEVKYQLDENGEFVLDENGNKIELTSPEMVVNWVHGDKIKVWASEIASRNEAEYSVNTNNQEQNYAVSLDKTGDYGIQWGTETSSDFCAIYPSDNVSKFEKNGDAIIASTSINATQNNVFAAVKDANGNIIGWNGTHFGNDAANPSMQNAIMFARTEDATPVDDNGNPKQVNLHFKPYTTVLKFRFLGYTSNLTDPTVYIQNITVKAPEGVAIAGDFNLGISGTGADAAATATLPTEEEGKSASDSIRVTTILPGGTYIPLKDGQYVDFNVYTIPQSYQMNATDKLWTVTIYTQGHGKFTYKMKPIPVNNGDGTTSPVTYNLTAGEIHKVKIPTLSINSQIEWNPENWITQIPVPVYISELSMPGTWYSCHHDYQNTTDLTLQYKAGVRAFNLDCRITYETEGGEDVLVDRGSIWTSEDDVYRAAEKYLVVAGTDGVGTAGSDYDSGDLVVDKLKTIAALIPNDEYVVVVLTIAEKPLTRNPLLGNTIVSGTVDPAQIIPAIKDIIDGNAKDSNGNVVTADMLKLYRNKVTSMTTIDDVKNHMIVKINTNNSGISNYTYPTNSLVSFASMALSDWNTKDDNITDLDSDYYTKMQTAIMHWGNAETDLNYYYHQAQRTTSGVNEYDTNGTLTGTDYSTTYQVEGVPTIQMRKDAIKNIISQSKAIYDNGAHDGWFQLGIGGYIKDNDYADPNQSDVATALNSYVQNLIEDKMDTDPSPVGIVLMNHACDASGNGIQLVKDIIEMNGKFYLNRVGGSITTGDGTNNSGNGTTTTETKNAAYAVVGDNAF